MKTILIGITGPTASGKSTVASLLTKNGYTVIDADQVTREVMAPNKPVLQELAKVFGDEILSPDGALNRRKLGDLAFVSKETTDLLNKTSFPFIKEHIAKLIDQEQQQEIEYLFLDAPTLIESELEKECDYVLAVLAPPEVRKERLLKRENDLTLEQIEQRIKAQPNDEFYRSKADFVLENTSLDSLEKEVMTLLNRIKK